MMKRVLSVAILLLIPTILIGIIYYGVHLYKTPYEDFINDTLLSIQREDLKETLTHTYFTPDKFQFIQITVWVLGGISLLLLLLFIRKFFRLRLYIEGRCEFLFHLLKNQFVVIKEMSDGQKACLLLILLFVLIRSVYYASQFYIQYDEAWNYNYFLRKNILFTLFAYNNYPLHNVMTFLFLKLTPDSTFFLRLPVIFFGIASCVSVFIIIRKIFSETWIAFLCVLFFASLPVNIYYMLYARGVMLNVFFLLWSFYAGWNMLKTSNKNSSILLICLNMLGTASIITHPIFIFMQWTAICLLFLVRREHTPIRKFVSVFALSLIGSLVVFLPFLLGSGIKNLLHSGSTLSIKYAIPYHSYSAFYSGAWWGFYVLVLIHIFFLFRKELKEYLFIVLLNLLLLSSIPLLHWALGYYPPERALPYLILPIVFGLGLIGRYLYSLHISWKWIGIPILFISLYLNYSAYHSKYMNWSKELDHQVFLLSEKLREKNIHSIYNAIVDFNYFVPSMTYYSSLHSYPLKYYTNQPNSTRYNPSMFDSTDAIVYTADSSLHYPVIFQLDDIAIYLKR